MRIRWYMGHRVDVGFAFLRNVRAHKRRVRLAAKHKLDVQALLKTPLKVKVSVR